MNDPRSQRIQDYVLRIAHSRALKARARYPQDLRLQYQDQVGYLVSIMCQMALKDSVVESDLYHILNKLEHTK
jgi:hypothetical protein